MKEGIFEHAQNELKRKSVEQLGVVFVRDIVDYIYTLQENKFDSHVIIQGQNGTGKSYFMLILLKLLAQKKGLDFKDVLRNNLFFAFDNTEKLMKKIVREENSVFGIDEAKKFLHYKLSMTAEQVALINVLEYARSRRNAFVVCTNDVRRLNNNYRNSKAQVVIWFLDRFKMDASKSKTSVYNYGLVFVGLPSVEEEDKFLLDDLEGLYNTEGIRVACENKPTMVGYLLIDHALNYLTEDEIKLYESLKEKGVVEGTYREIARFKSSDKDTQDIFIRQMLKKDKNNDMKKSKKEKKVNNGDFSDLL